MVLLFGPFQTGRKVSLTDELTMMGWRGLCRSLSGFLGDDHVVHRFDVTLLGCGCRILHGFENDGAASFSVPFFLLGMLPQ